MKLDRLKQELKEAENIRMESIYARIERMAKEDCSRVNFDHTSEFDNKDEMKINTRQMKQLESDGYEVDWEGETVTVSGWDENE